jgi:hypothetical protein
MEIEILKKRKNLQENRLVTRVGNGSNLRNKCFLCLCWVVLKW